MKYIVLLLLAVSSFMSGCSHMHPLELDDGDNGALLYRYSAKKCGPNKVLLPAIVEKADWVATAGDTNKYHCQGFTVYDIEQREPAKEFTTYVHSEAGKTCSVDVAIIAKHRCKSGAVQSCPKEESWRKVSDRILHFLGFSGDYQKDELLVFENYADFGKWCRKRVRQKVYAPEHLDAKPE